MTSTLSKIWESTDGCAEQYRCASALYYMSFLSQCFSIIIDRGKSATVHGKEVSDGINSIDKCCKYQLMSNVQILGSKPFYSHIIMHSYTHKNDVNID